MIPRATTSGILSRLSAYSTLHGTKLLQLQDQISSGIRIRKSSDDPLAFRQITSIQSQLKYLEDSKYVIEEAEGKLNASVSNLTEFQQVGASAQRLAQEGVQALSQEERNALALEAEGLQTRLKDLANARYNGQYLYGGSATERIPFVYGDRLLSGRTLEVGYAGSDKPGESVISASLSVETLYSGDAIFGTHTVTLVDTSGTGASGTISLNGGQAIAWDSSRTNLEVTGPNGERVYVNTSAITAGFSGSVNLTANGTLSVDGGATSVNIDFSTNQVVTDSLTGRMVTIDSSAVHRTGDDYLEFTGTSNAFQALDELILDLRGGRNVDNSQYADAVSRRLGELGKIADRVLTAVGLQSTSLAGLEQLKNRNEDLQGETQVRLGDLQDTDFAQAVIELTSAQMLQQYSFSVASQIMKQSLIDFLR